MGGELQGLKVCSAPQGSPGHSVRPGTRVGVTPAVPLHTRGPSAAVSPSGQFMLTSSQDQLRALRELVAAAFGSGGEEGLPAVEIYDGDTPMGER